MWLLTNSTEAGKCVNILMFLFFQIFLFFEKVTVFGAQHNTFMRILPMFVPDSKACQINLISKQGVESSVARSKILHPATFAI